VSAVYNTETGAGNTDGCAAERVVSDIAVIKTAKKKCDFVFYYGMKFIVQGGSTRSDTIGITFLQATSFCCDC
jgi:hypothetical protein